MLLIWHGPHVLYRGQYHGEEHLAQLGLWFPRKAAWLPQVANTAKKQMCSCEDIVLISLCSLSMNRPILCFTCSASSRLVSLRCAQATKTSGLQTFYCNTANYMILWGGKCGQSRYHRGTNSMATWRSWSGQQLSRGRHASPSSVLERKRKTICFKVKLCLPLSNSQLQKLTHLISYARPFKEADW